jgi:sulfofructose kinase
MARVPVPEIVGLGMSVLDLIQVVEHFPGAGGVTRVTGSLMMGGGPVPTALCAASRLGARTAILDRIGDDWRGQLIREDYGRFGVSTGFLAVEPGKRSTLGNVLVRKGDGERLLLYEEGDFTPFSADELPRGLLESCRILHLNGRHWPACLEAARIVRAAGGLVSFDGGAHRFDEKYAELFPLVDLLIVAAEFADRAVGPGARGDQLLRLGQWGARIAGITDGGRGSWFGERGGAAFHQPAFPVSVVDTTGCGDVFHGAFLASVLRGEDFVTCARAAAAAAAMSATALGGRGRLPDREELESFLAARP